MALETDKSSSENFCLRFEPSTISRPTLEQQIQQIIKQKGALRHITRASLQAEINRSGTDAAEFEAHKNEQEDESEDETPQSRQERLWKSREEMLQKLAYAQNEILSALDFVSLLTSGGSVAAQASMSPALKERVPVGSLDSKMIEKRDVSIANRQKLAQVSEGWKSDSFESTSEKFKQAAVRLQSEAQRQSKYWEQIASIKRHGWSVSRLPSDSRAVGVHFGFSVGAPQFRSKGFALLHQNESGHLQLDSRSVPEQNTTTNVSIIRNGVVTGSSRLRTLDKQDAQDINKNIQIARDALFEDELFYEVSREARSIANQGARTQANAVEADIGSQVQVRVIQTARNGDEESYFEGPDDQLAEYVGLNLRLLLLLEHNKLSLQRCKPPAQLTLTPQVRSEFALLRPIVAQLRHQASMSALRSTCTSLTNCFTHASINFSYDFVKKHESAFYDNLQQLRQPARSFLIVQIDDGRKIEVEIETYLGSPVYGTVFRTSDIDFNFVRSSSASFSVVDDAVEHLAHILTLELISQTPEFEVLRPYSGEVALKTSAKHTATVSVRPQRVSLTLGNAPKMMYVWRSSGLQVTPNAERKLQKSFKDVVEYLMRQT